MADGTLHLGELTIDLELREAARGDEVVRLSKNEANLLQYLAAAQGAPVSKERVHTDVFGYAPQVVSRAADFTVHRLRRKLEPDPKAPAYLLTVPSVGFRLVAGRAASTPQRRGAPLLLPAETTTFIGRDREQRAVLDALRGTGRPISLVGPGGVGKSRLAREVARAWWAEEHASVRYCALAEARDAAGLRARVARLFDVPPDRLDDAIAAAGATLLVLDNLEQVVDDAAEAVQHWLETAGSLRVLTTTRERLRLPGEVVVELGPLGDEDGPRLFVERALRRQPDFEDPEGAVPALVAALDGLPLAIELAAARSVALSPDQLLSRFRATGSLGEPLRGTQPRHASMERVLEWSWELLSADERRALARLACFRGGFDLEAAEAVLEGGQAGTAELVQALRDKSLLVQRSRRFDLLLIVRDFAERRDPDARATWARQADALIARHTPVFWRHVLEQRPEVLAEDHENLRVAVGRMDGEDPLRFARLVAVALLAMGPDRSDAFAEMLARAMAVPDLPAELGRRLALVHLQLAVHTNQRVPVDVAEAGRVADLARDAGAPLEEAFARFLGASLLRLRDPAAARTACEEGRRVLDALSPGALHVRHAMLSHALDHDADPTRHAVRPLQRILRLAHRVGAPWLEAPILVNLALEHGRASDPTSQRDAAQRAMTRAREHGQALAAQRAQHQLISALTSLGPLEEPADHVAELVASPGLRPPLALEVHLSGAAVAFASQDLDAVEDHVARARALLPFARVAWFAGVVDFWEGMALWAHWGDVDEACRLLERADAVAGAITPDLIRSRWLAMRAHTEPQADVGAAFDALETELASRGLPREHLAVDRAHLDLATAASQLEGGVALPENGFHVVCSRVLLASALAAMEHHGA